ncbi:hypothetical protein [Streptomyces sp. NBC_00134]|uniref:hypothetical protein n=1 Tax=Streptomyces sp. NBC_00134 TaxID=2975663 RepID=UPI003252CEFF
MAQIAGAADTAASAGADRIHRLEEIAVGRHVPVRAGRLRRSEFMIRPLTQA